MPLKWSTDDSNIVTIDDDGNYEILGNNGDVANITVCMKDNINVNDSIKIKVIEDIVLNKSIMVTPYENIIIKQGKSQDFKCGVYENGQLKSDVVTCEGYNVDNDCYTITKTESGFNVTNNRLSENPLLLKFSSIDCEDIYVQVELMGRI